MARTHMRAVLLVDSSCVTLSKLNLKGEGVGDGRGSFSSIGRENVPDRWKEVIETASSFEPPVAVPQTESQREECTGVGGKTE